MADPYSVLGVAKTASETEIKKAYRKLAKEYHPDMKPGDKAAQQKFQEITAAYEILSDAEKRRRYDAGEIDAAGSERSPFGFGGGFGGGGFQPGGFQGFSGADGFDLHFDEEAGDIFSSIFGRAGAKRGRSHHPAPSKGADDAYSLKIDFKEAALGAKRKIVLTSGRSLSITIPAGTSEGQVLRLKGQGYAGMHGGPAGDLLVTVHVAADAAFQRDGTHILTTVKLPLETAILGGSIVVPTLEGQVNMKVPAWTSSGVKLRLKGKGIPDGPGTHRGDQYVTLEVTLPEDVDARKSLEKWAEERVKASKA